MQGAKIPASHGVWGRRWVRHRGIKTADRHVDITTKKGVKRGEEL